MSRGAATAVVLVAVIGCGGSDASRDGGLDAGTPRADAGAVVDASPGEDADVDATVPSRIDALVARLEGATSAEELDAVLHEVAWTDGWPVLEDGRLLFATRWSDAPADVALVGDPNGWDETADPATTSATGTHHWVVMEMPTAPPLEGAKYKWWGSGDVFRAPPEATAYGFDDFGEHGWVRPPTTEPWLERFPDLESEHLERSRTVRALLPAGFRRGDAVRTLLMHDGQNLFHPDAPFGGWRVDEALAAGGWDDVLVVAVDNAPDRMDAYTHVPDTIGGSTVGGRADDYLSLLEGEVLPFARERWGIDASGSSLAVAGSSLGGLVSLYLALERPTLVHCVAALSPTLGWGAFAPGPADDALVKLFAAAGHGPVAIYLDSGGAVSGSCVDLDSDGVDEDSDDSDNYCTTIQLRDALVDAGYTLGDDLFHWYEPGASHDEAAWAARVPRMLDACDAAGWTAR